MFETVLSHLNVNKVYWRVIRFVAGQCSKNSIEEWSRQNSHIECREIRFELKYDNENRGYYMTVRGYEFHLRVFNSISHWWAQRTIPENLGRVRLGSIRNKNNWNNASERLFGSYSHSGIPGFPFRLFYSQEQNSRNIFRNKFLFRNIPNERALRKRGAEYPTLLFPPPVNENFTSQETQHTALRANSWCKVK